MAVRAFPGTMQRGAAAAGAGLSGATGGTKLTYTVPAGFEARIIGAWVNPTAGAADIAFMANPTGTLLSFQHSTTAMALTGGMVLTAGQQFRLEVLVADAASVFTGLICAEEYPVV